MELHELGDWAQQLLPPAPPGCSVRGVVLAPCQECGVSCCEGFQLRVDVLGISKYRDINLDPDPCHLVGWYCSPRCALCSVRRLRNEPGRSATEQGELDAVYEANSTWHCLEIPHSDPGVDMQVVRQCNKYDAYGLAPKPAALVLEQLPANQMPSYKRTLERIRKCNELVEERERKRRARQPRRLVPRRLQPSVRSSGTRSRPHVASKWNGISSKKRR